MTNPWPAHPDPALLVGLVILIGVLHLLSDEGRRAVADLLRALWTRVTQDRRRP